MVAYLRVAGKNRKLKLRRRLQPERHKFAYLTMKNNSFAHFARAIFIFRKFRRRCRSFHDVKWPVLQLCAFCIILLNVIEVPFFVLWRSLKENKCDYLGHSEHNLFPRVNCCKISQAQVADAYLFWKIAQSLNKRSWRQCRRHEDIKRRASLVSRQFSAIFVVWTSFVTLR